jgi:hypothetical protein
MPLRVPLPRGFAAYPDSKLRQKSGMTKKRLEVIAAILDNSPKCSTKTRTKDSLMIHPMLLTVHFLRRRLNGLANVPIVLCGILSASSGSVGFSQIVQLPSFHNFGVSTSVSVPDRGSAALGGFGYAAHGNNSSGMGPYASRALSTQHGGSSVSIGVQIIDLQAMDEAILGGSQTTYSASASSQRNYVSSNPRQVAGGSTLRDSGAWQRIMSKGYGDAIPPSASEAETNIRYYLQRAAAAEQANRINSARVYYEMAMKSMTPQLMARYQQILATRALEAEEKRKAEAAKPVVRF